MKLKIPVILLFLLSTCAVALAHDFAPPDYRGGQLSYYAEWDVFTNGTFGTGIYTDAESSVDDNDPNTFLYNQFGTHLDFDAGGGWLLTPAQGGGFWNPGRAGTFQAAVINWVDWLPEKHLRVQLTYTDGGNGAPTITDVSGYGADPPTGSGDTPHGTIDVGRVDLDANHFYHDFIILPNPDFELIDFSLPMGTIVEQIVIDSISVPEPVGLGLMGVALLALRRRRS